MKMIIRPMLFVLTLTLFLTSCNNEELFVEDLTEVVTPNDPDGTTPEEDVDATNPDASLPCDFDLNNLQPNQTIIINCIMDLNGATINVPSSVTILYEGGDIINGTLNFLDNATISGELLNSTLTMGGAKPQLKDPAFDFNPKRWGIVEGKVTSEVALKNRDILESIIARIKDLGVSTFKIDKMDAYFEVSLVTSGTTNQNFYASKEAINVPGDFNLVMSENTHLRVQPNSRKTYALMAIRDENNATISGGILHGDRDEHDYSDGTSHEWGYLVFLEGATNSTISEMKLINSTGDGVKIQSINFTFQSNYKPSTNVTVTRCIMDNNRRNNMSITGGEFIYIDNNQFLNASNDTSKSDGVAPGFALDIEATRKRDAATGELIYYERADNIFITNNIEKNSRAGGFTVAIGYDVTIENNTVESGISFSLANGVKIIGNTVTAVTEQKKASGTGIKAGRTNASNETIYNNQVYGNKVVGFGTGIMVANRDVSIYNNTIENCAIGISLIDLSDAEIKNNYINSIRDGSLGVSLSSTTANNVSILENNINVSRNPLKFNSVNSGVDSRLYKIMVSNNSLSNLDNSSSFVYNSYNVVFNNNTLDHGFEVFDSHYISFTENIIKTNNDHGFDIRLVNTGLVLSNNDISVGDNKQCVNIDSTTSVSEVTVVNNICN